VSTRNIIPEAKKKAVSKLGPPLKVEAFASDQVEKLFSRSGEDVLVVVEDDRILGLLSRLVWEKASSYHLSLMPGELAFEIPQIFQILPDEEIFSLFQNPLRRIFWGEDLLSLEDFWVLRPPEDLSPRRLVLKGDLAYLREELLSVAQDLKIGLFLVGGAVRDLLLKRESFDLDFVVTRNCKVFAEVVSQKLKAPLVKSSLFGTFKLSWRGFEIDLAQARWEYYEAPAKLPKVAPGPLSWDLFRRDFTINALALDLETLTLVDFYGGERDLHERRLEVLHILSFVDDPTRLFRAARYATRFGLSLSPNFLKALELARRLKVISLLSPARLRNEIKRILVEEEPFAAFVWLKERKLLEELCGKEPDLSPLKRLLADSFFRDLNEDEKLVAILLSLSPQKDFLIRLGLSEKMSTWCENFFQELENKRNFLLSSKVSLSEKVFFLEKGPLSAILAFKAHYPELKEEMEKILAAQKTRPCLTGKDLQRMGISPGPLYGKILKHLRAAKIDGLLKNRDDEISFLKKEYPDVFSA